MTWNKIDADKLKTITADLIKLSNVLDDVLVLEDYL